MKNKTILEEFDEKFIFEDDNGQGTFNVLHRINKDRSHSIATDKDIKAFLTKALEEKEDEVKKMVKEMIGSFDKKYFLEYTKDWNERMKCEKELLACQNQKRQECINIAKKYGFNLDV